MDFIKQLIEWSATGIEILTVVAIIASITFGTLRFLVHLNRQVDDAYQQYRTHLGKMLILAFSSFSWRRTLSGLSYLTRH